MSLGLRAVSLRLGGQTLLPPLSTDVPAGQVLVVMGPSGSGKSTLLAWLAGLPIAPLEAEGSLARLDALAIEQARLRDRLMELAVFWQRCAAAWASLHPETAERRHVEALGRNAMQRLALAELYAPP